MSPNRITVTNPCIPLSLKMPLEVEVGCGKGRFLTTRATRDKHCTYLGIERMLERVQSFERKCARAQLTNAFVLRLEALYTFQYLLPEHGIRRVWVFFPDPWPKRRHHSHRLFGPLFLEALWHRLEIGGELQFATDHHDYFQVVKACFKQDDALRQARGLPPRWEETTSIARDEDEWTEFETLFRGQGLPIYSAAWRTLKDVHATTLVPLKIPPEDEPREGIIRRNSHGKEWHEAQQIQSMEIKDEEEEE